MKASDKKRFIQDLLDGLRETLIQKVDQMPEEWDGFELRWLIADTAAENTFGNVTHKQRKAEYRNERLVRNL